MFRGSRLMHFTPCFCFTILMNTIYFQESRAQCHEAGDDMGRTAARLSLRFLIYWLARRELIT